MGTHSGLEVAPQAELALRRDQSRILRTRPIQNVTGDNGVRDLSMELRCNAATSCGMHLIGDNPVLAGD